MKLKKLIVTVVVSAIIGISGGVLLGEIEVADIRAQIRSAEADNLSYEAGELIDAIDNVLAYQADPDNHRLSWYDVEIINTWMRDGI